MSVRPGNYIGDMIDFRVVSYYWDGQFWRKTLENYERGWYITKNGDLRFVVGRLTNGDYAVEIKCGSACEVSGYSMHSRGYIPVPECTGWDWNWKPKPKMRPKTLADCPEGVWVPCRKNPFGVEFYKRIGDTARIIQQYSWEEVNSIYPIDSLLVHPPEEVQDSQ